MRDHPARLPFREIQEALGPDNPIRGFWIQNPTDGTNPRDRKRGVRIAFDSKHWVEATGDGNNVWEASMDLIRNIEKWNKRCPYGCPIEHDHPEREVME